MMLGLGPALDLVSGVVFLSSRVLHGLSRRSLLASVQGLLLGAGPDAMVSDIVAKPYLVRSVLQAEEIYPSR